MVSLKKLREETYALHTQVENNPKLKKLTEDFNLEDYLIVLKKIYGFYLPFENSLNWGEIEQFPGGKLISSRKKVHLLEEDLRYFQIPLNTLPLSQEYPKPTCYPFLLGCFYVLEGSCLGRKILWPKISQKLDLQSNGGGRFFSDHGENSKESWKGFCNFLTSEANSESDQEKCLEASLQTFETIDRWFKI